MKRVNARILSFFLIIAISLTFVPASAVEDSYGEFGLSIVEDLNNMPARRAGTAYEIAASTWLLGQLEDIGYNAYTQPFSYYLGFTDYSQNVIVEKQGNSDKTIVITAHYDSVSINNSKGADDNASGVGVVLETAKRVFDIDLPYTVVFLFCGAEEMGLYGSKAYVQSLTTEEKSNIILNINVDSILAGDNIYMNGGNNGRSRGLVVDGKSVTRLWGYNQMALMVDELNLNILSNPGTYRDGESFYPFPSTGAWSDHDPFDEAGIPYVYFEAGNWDLPNYNGQNQTIEYGPIIHTEYDSLLWIEEHYPGRALDHISTIVKLLEQFLLNVEEPEDIAWEDANYNLLTPLANVPPVVVANDTFVSVDFGFPIQTYNSAPTPQNFILTDNNDMIYPVHKIDYTWIENGVILLFIENNDGGYPTNLEFKKLFNLIIKDETTSYVNSFSTEIYEDFSVTSPVSTIVENAAANIPVNFYCNSDTFSDIPMYVGLFDGDQLIEGTKTELSLFSAKIKITDTPEAGNYKIAVFYDIGFGCNIIAKTNINVVTPPNNLWIPLLSNMGGKLNIVFADTISISESKYKVTINGNLVQSIVNTNDIVIDYDSIVSGDTIIISGVKYPILYPSYSFTFTIVVP